MAEKAVITRLMRKAAGVFSKANTGSALTPFSDTWDRIAMYCEHALWTWNEKYGPLNVAQRDYAVELLTFAIGEADKAPDKGGRYAYFHQAVTTLLNHERVHAGMRQRASEESNVVELDLFRDVA